MKKVLVFDIGASNGRAMLATFNGETIFLEEIYRFSNDAVTINGSMFWDILYLFRQIMLGIIKCVLNGHKDIISIAFDTWGVDFALLDKDGDLLSNPYHYRDKRTQNIDKHIEKRLGLNELYMQSGIQNMWFNTSFQLLAMIMSKRLQLERAEHLLMIPDLIGYFFTGVIRNEFSVASTTQLFDINLMRWNDALIRSLNVPSKIFGQVIQPGEKLGRIKEELAQELGIEPLDIIAVASHDTASAVIAIPQTSKNIGFISSGTWSIIGIELEKPIINKKALEYGFSNEGLMQGKIKFLKNVMGLWLLQ